MKFARQSPLLESIAGLPAPISGRSRLALINQAAFANCRGIIAQLEIFERYALLDQPTEACSDGATPFLVSIHHLSDSQSGVWSRLCDHACYANAISVLDTALSPPLLANALTQRCEVTLSDDQSVILRFFDTRIIEPLVDVLDQEQRRQFFGCISTWWYSSRDGRMKQIVDCGHATPEASGPLKLSARQTLALKAASEADGIVDLLMKTGSIPLSGIPYPKRHERIVKGLEAGKQLGLVSRQDLVAYCALSLEVDASTLAAPPWQPLLERVRKGELTFLDALEVAETETIT